MAGRLKGLHEQLERLAQQAEALADELEAMATKYTRMHGGLWKERADAGWLALMQANEQLEWLTLMARDLAKGQGDEERCTEAPKVTETASKGDPR
ncbi:MAG: hypothetical protein QUV05_04165 [Phycisphaerae bacterium]|nr:hypothetical protein [Phycisphaerae bacterium]